MKYIIILFLSIFTITAYSEQKINSSIGNEWSNNRYTDHGNGTVTDSKRKLMQKINSSIGNEWPNNRYTDHGNGTVTDSKTKLMWKKCSEGQTGNSCSGDSAPYTWKSAFEVAKNSTFAGYSDWRLPNLKELASLAALDRIHPSINIQIFPNTVIDYYWSSSPHLNNSDYSWVLNFNDGSNNNATRSWRLRVRLVRSGQ